MIFFTRTSFYPVLLFFSFLTGCDSANADKKEEGKPLATAQPAGQASSTKAIVHYNFIITPDLSNRLLRPKAVSDQQVVKTILKNIHPTILNYGGTVNQQDVFSTSVVSNRLITKYQIRTEDLKIDFSRFGIKQMNRIQYINGQGEGGSLEKDKSKFLQEFTRVSQAAASSTSGADIWSYFNSGISNATVRGKMEDSYFNKKSYKNEYRNIMVLLTDGYIEAAMFGKKACSLGNQCYYLSGQRIKDFREAFRKSGMKNMREFFEKNKYGIVPAQNENLKNLEVLVLQMEDRSLDKAGNATVVPTDMEILKLFWSDWLTKSGVKRFELQPVLASEAETEQVILDFMGIKGG